MFSRFASTPWDPDNGERSQLRGVPYPLGTRYSSNNRNPLVRSLSYTLPQQLKGMPRTCASRPHLCSRTASAVIWFNTTILTSSPLQTIRIRSPPSDSSVIQPFINSSLTPFHDVPFAVCKPLNVNTLCILGYRVILKAGIRTLSTPLDISLGHTEIYILEDLNWSSTRKF